MLRDRRWHSAVLLFALVGAAVSGPRLFAWQASDARRPDPAKLKQELSEMQFEVTQRGGTEPPFRNIYWDNHQAGLYVDVISGEPLFSSLDKYDSGTGWPSFTRPLTKEAVITKPDNSLFTRRTEVLSKIAGSHLGHVFDDGPAPTGLRYCMNSAALRFVPAAALAREGYGEYASLFAAPSPSPAPANTPAKRK